MNRFLSVRWLPLFCAVVALASAAGQAAMLGITQQTDPDAGSQNLAAAGVTEAGYEFETGALPIAVTALGVWDASGDTTPTPGLNASHEIAIWNNGGGSPLVDLIVPAGNSGVQVNNWLFELLDTPLVLSPNTDFVIATASTPATGTSDVFHNSTLNPAYFPVFNPGIAFIERRGDGSGSFVYPDVFLENGASAWDAPNFEFTVPEPAALSMILLGGAAVLRRRLRA